MKHTLVLNLMMPVVHLCSQKPEQKRDVIELYLVPSSEISEEQLKDLQLATGKVINADNVNVKSQLNIFNNFYPRANEAGIWSKYRTDYQTIGNGVEIERVFQIGFCP
jgi:hypothetical protein